MRFTNRITQRIRPGREVSGRRHRASAGLLVVLLCAGVLAAAPEGAAQHIAAAATAAGPQASAGDIVTLLPLSTRDRRFVDSAGRDILLRGANLNSLGEYWQGVPTIDPTIPVRQADWDAMATHGFSVVRLVISWSRVEPTRGIIDQSYLDEVDAAVAAAAARGIYSVIDMHQDAFTAFLSTSDATTCPPGTTPAKGWDGAPAWAVRSDGLSTCLTNGERNSSPAVNRAWNNFYDDVDGIRTEFASAWASVASRFAGRPEVAGYDILNEPENPRPAAEMQPIYDDFLVDVITAIRGAESSAPFSHVIFVEPALPAGDVSRGLVIPSPAALGGNVENISASVHNYSESIGIAGVSVTIEGLNDLIEQLTAGLGVPNWGGEYGFWDTSPATLEKARRYAADEDRRAWGGAWWQWRQSCGDPHAVQWSGNQVEAPSGVSTQLNLLGCPANTDLGPNDDFLRIVGRGYPRATPGHIDELRSDPDTGLMKVKATAGARGGQLVVWSPTSDDPAHPVNTSGLVDIQQHVVPGGRLITATVAEAGTYALWIGQPDEDLGNTTTTVAPRSNGTSPVLATPRFTG